MMGASEVHWCGKVRGMSPKSFIKFEKEVRSIVVTFIGKGRTSCPIDFGNCQECFFLRRDILLIGTYF